MMLAAVLGALGLGMIIGTSVGLCLAAMLMDIEDGE
jgi:hypothetical protein